MVTVAILQKRALHLIFFSSKRSHAIPLFITSNILLVNMLYFETVFAIMHDVFTISTPRNFLFIHLTSIHIILIAFPQRNFMYRGLVACEFF